MTHALLSSIWGMKHEGRSLFGAPYHTTVTEATGRRGHDVEMLLVSAQRCN